MRYTVENINAYLEKRNEQYDSANPLHISFACRRLEDDRDGTQKAFQKLCHLTNPQQVNAETWIEIDEFLEARMSQRGGLDCIEVREKTSHDVFQNGSILKVPVVLYEHNIINDEEKNDFELLLSVSKTLREMLPVQLEEEAKLRR